MLHSGEKKNDIQWVRLHPGEVEAVLAIRKMPAIAQCIRGLQDRVFNDMRFFIRESDEGVAVPSPAMDLVTARYWNPWGRGAHEWLVSFGVIPYVSVPYTKIAGRGCIAVNPALGDLCVAKSPYPSEGYIMTGRKSGDNFEPQQYKWVWTSAKKRKVNVRFVHCSDCAPDVVTGRLNSLLSNLIPEWIFLKQAEHAMQVSENLNQYPPLLISTPAPSTPTGNGHARGHIGGPPISVPPDRSYHSIGAVRIDDERWMRERYEDDKFREAIAEAATKVCASTWGTEKSAIHKEADYAFERQLERRFVLPKGAKLEKMPKSEGITRMEYQQLTREFEDHGAALIAISAGARAPHGNINTKDGASYDEGFRRTVIVARKRQFRTILRDVFAICNWRLFEEELLGEGVSQRPASNSEWISVWAADKIDVYLGPVDEEEGHAMQTPEEIQSDLASKQKDKRQRDTGGEEDDSHDGGDKDNKDEPGSKDDSLPKKRKRKKKKRSIRSRMRPVEGALPHELALETQIADITK